MCSSFPGIADSIKRVEERRLDGHFEKTNPICEFANPDPFGKIAGDMIASGT